MSRIKVLISVLAALALAACGRPVPTERVDYVGEWRSATMYLLITADGHVEYKRVAGSSTKSISAPLKGFNGENFEVGIGPMSTVFEVSQRPHYDGTQWKMVVDGLELTRSPGPGASVKF